MDMCDDNRDDSLYSLNFVLNGSNGDIIESF